MKMTAGYEEIALFHETDCLKGTFEEETGKSVLQIGISPDCSNVPFPLKLHAMLDDAASNGLDHIVSWRYDGHAFMVHDIESFVKMILHQYFNQTRYKSFQRQLNIYGFKRVAKGREKGMCFHPLFVRGQPMLCVGMQRTKIKQPEIMSVPSAVLSKHDDTSSDSDDSSSSQEENSYMEDIFDVAFFAGKTFYPVEESQNFSILSEDNEDSEKKLLEVESSQTPPRPHNNCRNDSFPWKLYDMLEQVKLDGQEHIVSWEQDGKALKVHDPSEFGKKILPIYFLHTKKWESFQRQLNLYGFTRIARGPSKGMYMHPHFSRGHRSLCRHITRPR